ncbi:MAG: hypothetical protein HKN32_06745 [Flavobacteriales bacterium]|nr:hypothetical protein [Flavobacteriales bacterium]
MTRIRQLTITFILIWILAKLGVMFSGNAVSAFGFMVLLNLLFILLIQFFFLHFKYKEIDKLESNFLNDPVGTMRAAANYIIVIVVFSVAYYTLIDPSFDAFRVNEAAEFAQEQVNDPEYFEELKRRNPTIPPETTADEYVENARQQAMWFAKWHIRAGGSLLVLVLMSAFNSVFVTLLFRKVMLK